MGLLRSWCCGKTTAAHNVGTDSDDTLTRIDHLGPRNVSRRHVFAVFDSQTLHEHTPGLLGLNVLDAT